MFVHICILNVKLLHLQPPQVLHANQLSKPDISSFSALYTKIIFYVFLSPYHDIDLPGELLEVDDHHLGVLLPQGHQLLPFVS